MGRTIAFLRGINVGGHRVKMARIRELFEELDFPDVSTFIASGNVIFTASETDVASVTQRIETHLAQALGYEVPVFLRTLEELRALCAYAPGWEGAPTPEDSHHVMLLREVAPPELRQALSDLSSGTDAFDFEGREVHWRIRGTMSQSPLFAGALSRATRGTLHTARNATSLKRLLAKIEA